MVVSAGIALEWCGQGLGRAMGFRQLAGKQSSRVDQLPSAEGGEGRALSRSPPATESQLRGDPDLPVLPAQKSTRFVINGLICDSALKGLHNTTGPLNQTREIRSHARVGGLGILGGRAQDHRNARVRYGTFPVR